MNKEINIGPIDKTMRLIVGVLMLFLGLIFLGVFSVGYGLILCVVGLILLVTGLTNNCLVYRVFGFTTKPKLPCN